MDLSTILDGKLDKEFLTQLFQEQEEVYKAAIELALNNNHPLAWRAAWILAGCTQKNDPRIQPFVNNFIKEIHLKKDGHQREILRTLLLMKLDDEQEGHLFDICMTLWENINKTPSIRYLAFKVIYQICEKHSELKDELLFITQNQYLESLSPGIKKGVQKHMLSFNK